MVTPILSSATDSLHPVLTHFYPPPSLCPSLLAYFGTTAFLFPPSPLIFTSISLTSGAFLALTSPARLLSMVTHSSPPGYSLLPPGYLQMLHTPPPRVLVSSARLLARVTYSSPQVTHIFRPATCKGYTLLPTGYSFIPTGCLQRLHTSPHRVLIFFRPAT